MTRSEEWLAAKRKQAMEAIQEMFPAIAPKLDETDAMEIMQGMLVSTINGIRLAAKADIDPENATPDELTRALAAIEEIASIIRARNEIFGDSLPRGVKLDEESEKDEEAKPAKPESKSTAPDDLDQSDIDAIGEAIAEVLQNRLLEKTGGATVRYVRGIRILEDQRVRRSLASPVAKEEHMKKYTITIERESDDECNPRQWDHLGTMACWHRKYNLGDEQPKESLGGWLATLLHYVGAESSAVRYANKLVPWGEFEDDLEWQDPHAIQKAWKILEEYIIVLPLYLLDHSGITMSVTPFSDPWDSMQVGYIYVTLDDVREQYGRKRITGNLRKRIEERLVAEVEEYDLALRGEVYYVAVLDGDGEGFDSAGCILGLSEAKAVAADMIAEVLT